MIDLSFKQASGEPEYKHANPNKAISYLFPAVLDLLRSHPGGVRSVIDIGCGTGDLAARLTNIGFETLAVDASADAIHQARRKYPELRLKSYSIYDDPGACGGPWDAAVSTEVIEHLFYPRRLMVVAIELLKPGGLFVLTTPYHGYVKYLALALSGRMDSHLQALRDHGHIKFFSRTSIERLFEEAGFVDIRIATVGRVGPLAKSLIVSGRKAPA